MGIDELRQPAGLVEKETRLNLDLLFLNSFGTKIKESAYIPKVKPTAQVLGFMGGGNLMISNCKWFIAELGQLLPGTSQ